MWSPLLLSQKSKGLKDSSSAEGRRQPLLSKNMASIWSTLQSLLCPCVMMNNPGQTPCMPPSSCQRSQNLQGHLGPLSHPRENSDAVECRHFPFWPAGAEQRRSSKDFLLGRNPPSQQYINVSAPLLVSSYKNPASRTQCLACVST